MTHALMAEDSLTESNDMRVWAGRDSEAVSGGMLDRDMSVKASALT